MLKRIFCKRRIVVVTDEDISAIPLSVFSQLFVLFLVCGVVSWASFSSGKYFSYKEVVKQKEIEVHQANLINLDLQSRIDSLQGNLVRLNNYFSTVKNFDHNQGKNRKSGSRRSNKKHDKTSRILKKSKETLPRISFLEKDTIVKNINENTLSRIQDLEKIIAMTGLSLSNVAPASETKITLFEEYYDPNLSKGGPETHNTSPEQFQLAEGANIDEGIGFAENVSKLLYLENLLNSLPVSIPMKRYYISSLFGNRVDPLLERAAHHYGVDFAGPKEAEVFSTGPGVVKFAGKKGNYGIFVEIDHGYNITTRYGHLTTALVQKGQHVKRGQLVGLQGSTGRSTGQHLHYEMRYKNKPYDPLKFIKAGKYVL